MSARTDAEATTNQLSSGVTPEHLQTVLKDKLEAQHVEIADLSGTAPRPAQKHPPHMYNRLRFIASGRLRIKKKDRQSREEEEEEEDKS